MSRRKRSSLALAAIIAAVGAAAGESAEFRLREPGEAGGAVEVELAGVAEPVLRSLRSANLDASRWRAVMPVRVAAAAASAPPMLGAYRIERDAVVFTPRFSLRPGLAYRAAFEPAALPDGGAGAERVEATLSLPAAMKAEAATTVAAVFPSGDELPENLLKFYIHFSAPMSRGASYRHIALVDDRGQPVSAPFLEIGEELWDREGRRLTVLLDPGRIKRGLKPREEAGPALVAGRSYELIIGADWPDAQGTPLRAEFRKKFRVAAPDGVQPDPRKWKVTAPAGSRKELTVQFEEPLDRAMLDRAIEVVDSSGAVIEGTIAVDQHEARWSFRPTAAWRAGRCELQIDLALEDRAGNSVGRPFEVDGTAAEGKAGDGPPRRLPFEVVGGD